MKSEKLYILYIFIFFIFFTKKVYNNIMNSIKLQI